MRVNGEPPPLEERLAFCDQLREIRVAGGSIKLVQIYTIARKPAESFVAPLTAAEVDSFVDLVRERTNLEVRRLLRIVGGINERTTSQTRR